ncbi:MAG: hypothetical protein FWF77_09670 [Defluviitaleaceae bacterium]|nr:hypothetical protein [Defluviitaleaceae bacterium]
MDAEKSFYSSNNFKEATNERRKRRRFGVLASKILIERDFFGDGVNARHLFCLHIVMDSLFWRGTSQNRAVAALPRILNRIYQKINRILFF